MMIELLLPTRQPGSGSTAVAAHRQRRQGFAHGDHRNQKNKIPLEESTRIHLGSGRQRQQLQKRRLLLIRHGQQQRERVGSGGLGMIRPSSEYKRRVTLAVLLAKFSYIVDYEEQEQERVLVLPTVTRPSKDTFRRFGSTPSLSSSSSSSSALFSCGDSSLKMLLSLWDDGLEDRISIWYENDTSTVQLFCDLYVKLCNYSIASNHRKSYLDAPHFGCCHRSCRHRRQQQQHPPSEQDEEAQATSSSPPSPSIAASVVTSRRRNGCQDLRRRRHHHHPAAIILCVAYLSSLKRRISSPAVTTTTRVLQEQKTPAGLCSSDYRMRRQTEEDNGHRHPHHQEDHDGGLDDFDDHEDLANDYWQAVSYLARYFVEVTTSSSSSGSKNINNNRNHSNSCGSGLDEKLDCLRLLLSMMIVDIGGGDEDDVRRRRCRLRRRNGRRYCVRRQQQQQEVTIANSVVVDTYHWITNYCHFYDDEAPDDHEDEDEVEQALYAHEVEQALYDHHKDENIDLKKKDRHSSSSSSLPTSLKILYSRCGGNNDCHDGVSGGGGRCSWLVLLDLRTLAIQELDRRIRYERRCECIIRVGVKSANVILQGARFIDKITQRSTNVVVTSIDDAGKYIKERKLLGEPTSRPLSLDDRPVVVTRAYTDLAKRVTEQTRTTTLDAVNGISDFVATKCVQPTVLAVQQRRYNNSSDCCCCCCCCSNSGVNDGCAVSMAPAFDDHNGMVKRPMSETVTTTTTQTAADGVSSAAATSSTNTAAAIADASCRIGMAGFGAAVSISDTMTASTKTVTTSLVDATEDIISYKYGDGAGICVREVADTAGNIVKTVAYASMLIKTPHKSVTKLVAKNHCRTHVLLKKKQQHQQPNQAPHNP